MINQKGKMKMIIVENMFFDLNVSKSTKVFTVNSKYTIHPTSFLNNTPCVHVGVHCCYSLPFGICIENL